jgi:hypothetical protein
MYKLAYVVCQTAPQSGWHRVILGGHAATFADKIAVGEKPDDNMIIPALFIIGGMEINPGPKRF